MQKLWTAAPGCPAYHAYSTNYLVDVESGVIVDVEATSAHRTEETEVTKTMIERVEERPDIKPQRLIGDTAYGTGPMLEWLVQDKGIASPAFITQADTIIYRSVGMAARSRYRDLPVSFSTE